MRVLSKLVVHAGLLSALTAITADAQLLLQARQGNTWVGRLNLSRLVTMDFRVKAEGQAEVGTDAFWEIVHGLPAGRENPEIRATRRFKLASTVSDFVRFRIAPEQLQDHVPSKFYVRVRSGRSVSSWLPVTVEVPRRAAATLPAPPPPDPLEVAKAIGAEPPLWIKLTKIICKATSNDGNASDEVYAVLGSIALNKEKPWTSPVYTAVTKVYEDMDAEDFRSVDATLWGPPSGNPVVIRKPGDVILLFQLMEWDSGRPALAGPLTLASLMKEVSNFNPGKSYSTMAYDAMLAFSTGAFSAGAKSDDQIGTAQQLKLTQNEIDQARGGTVVKKELIVGREGDGIYVLRFQMGRVGKSTVAW